MDSRTIASALISTDQDFRQALKQCLTSTESGIAIGLELAIPFREINDLHLEQLRQLDPELIFLDLGDDAQIGLKFAQFLIDSAPERRLIGAGPELSPELLMSAMQAGISEYLPKPVQEDALSEAIDRTARKFGRKVEDQRREPGSVFAVFGPKGGAGSTTMSVNVAVELHRITRKKTLLIDFDLELGETALLMGVEPRFSFVDLVRNFHRVDAGLLASYIEHHESGVDLLSAPFHPTKAEVVTGGQIRQILQFLKEHYEYIVLDIQRSFTPTTLAALEQADALFMVSVLDLPSLRNISRCLPLLERIGAGKGKEWLRIVVNRYQPNSVISIDEVKRILGLEVYWQLPNEYEAVMESITSGSPLVLNDKSAYSRELRALCARLAGLDGSADKSSGWLSRKLGLKKKKKKKKTRSKGVRNPNLAPDRV
jgi:pilus assembly protein CpaE